MAFETGDQDQGAFAGGLTVRPISNIVLVRKTQLVPKERTTEGGIILPDVVEKKNPHQIGRVLAIGPGKLLDDGTRVKPDFKVGDQVVYNPYSGRVVNPRLSLYELLLPADEVLGVLEESLE
jgi:chaperonin GroES